MRTPDIYDKIATLVGEDTAAKLAEYFAGQKVYFPVWDRRRQERDRAIVRAHNKGRGLSVSDLAHRYGISPRRVRQILSAAREEDEDE